jgi:hypothetical protein
VVGKGTVIEARSGQRSAPIAGECRQLKPGSSSRKLISNSFFEYGQSAKEFSCFGFGSVTVKQRRSKPVEYCLRHISVALSNVASWHHTGNGRAVVLDTSLRVK